MAYEHARRRECLSRDLRDVSQWPQAYLPLMLTACLKMGRKLKIVGTGNQIEKLKAPATENPYIEFLGRVSNEALRASYANAKALIFPGVEDFGIVPLEAQAAG